MVMKSLAIHATRNTTKPDATGAFVPEAKAFAKVHGAELAGYDNKLDVGRRRAAVRSILRARSSVQLLAFFGHGYRDGMQTGHHMPHVEDLADDIAYACAPRYDRLVVYLAACSTARQLDVARGGFADALRDALSARGIAGHIDAHTTAGHTTRNPHVQRFEMGAPPDELAGDWIVAPDDPLWRAWVRALKSGNLRLRFPLMSRDEIRAELSAAG